MKKSIIFLFLLIFSFTLTSCSAFFGDEEVPYIVGITPNTDESKLLIEYSDGTISSIDMPRGEDGLIGNGISDVEINDKNKDYVTITIKYTDFSFEDQTFTIYHGRTLEDFVVETDPLTGIKTIYLKYSDGTVSENSITLEPGKDGVGIEKIEPSEDGKLWTVYFTNGTTQDIVIPVIPGEDGLGIFNVEPVDSTDPLLKDYYILRITYTNGDSVDIPFPKPQKANTWLKFDTGFGPGPNDGNVGDFAFDTRAKIIYYKIAEGTWQIIINFNEQIKQTTVVFNLNDDDGGIAAEELEKSQFTIVSGSNFASADTQLPYPTRTGYTFDGWYTVKNPNITNGMFTDITTVSGDIITLYAKWIKN